MNRSEGCDTQLHKPVFELLAPAGTPEIFRAVIAAGADAVYLGGNRFGARAYAGNFTDAELLDAVDYAHLYGRKVYLTINTLFKNRELEEELFDYLLPLYERGLDAVLVQDMGVFSLIRSAFPELGVHASTQMTVTGVDGVRLLTQLGAERIVLARELSLAEIREIYEQTGAQLEVFVHGALCYCYSGQCLFSSLLGGRSGNRGRCAQPCRLPYALSGGGRKLSDSYVLSLKDLCGIENLNRLHAAGAYSLKIEGRMKQLSYAAGVVAIYRRQIDEYLRLSEASGGAEELLDSACALPQEERRRLYSLGNRSGFTDAYYHRRNGADMLTFDKPGYERADGESERSAAECCKVPRKLAANGTLHLRAGERTRYEVRCGEVCVSAEGPEVQRALNKPLLCGEAGARMEKTGDTAFVMERVDVEMEGDVFLPNGALNRLRRDALEGVKEELLKEFRRELKPIAAAVQGSGIPQARGAGMAGAGREPAARERVICLTENRSLLEVILREEFVTTVYLDAGAYSEETLADALAEDAARCREAGREACFVLPRVFRTRTAERCRKLADLLRELPLDGIVVRNYEELYFAAHEFPELALVIDHGLYTYNNRAVRAFCALGAARDTVPLELNAGEIAHRDNSGSEMVVYGHYPLMTSAQCVRGNTGGCDRTPGTLFLTDRKHSKFPVKNYCADCYNVVYNSLPTLLFASLGELRRAGIRGFRLDFTVESAQRAGQVLKLYRRFAEGEIDSYPAEWKGRYTGGHYRRGVE